MKKAAVPFGLKPAKRHAPKKLRTTQDVVDLQRFMMHAMVRPLTSDDRLQETWSDGRSMALVASEFIKPNDRLTSVERLEIYSRMYWFRLIENFARDCPGLQAYLGDTVFNAVGQAYLAKYPSRSFTLRNLCERLPKFLAENPELTAPRTELAIMLARFEWAQTTAFDSLAKPVLTPRDIAKTPPTRLKLALQPFVTLLHSTHAIDNFAIAVAKREALRGEASNASIEDPVAMKPRKVRSPKAEEVWLAVHRQDNQLYYKRLHPAAFAILTAIEAGKPLTRAIAAGGARVTPKMVQTWFASWMGLGWLTLRK